MSLLLIASLFTLLTPTLGHPAKPAKDQARPELKDLKVEKGRQIGERIKKLKDTNLNVKAALAEFEKGSGRHLPKLDEAVTFSAKVKGTTTAPVARNPSIFRQASFRPQQSTFTDTGVDVTFITAVDLYNEWQGTVIANFSNAAGVETDIHDLVITRSDYNPSEWTVRYDLIVENGVASIATMPGMFTGFALGVPILEHQTIFGAPPPQDIEPWQFADAGQEQQYYELYPLQRIYDVPPDRNPGLEQPFVSRRTGRGLFRAASFSPQRACSETDCRRPINNTGNIGFRMTGGRNFGSAVGIGCTASAGGCAIAGAFSGGTAFVPCMASRCGSVVIASGLAFLRIQVYIF